MKVKALIDCVGVGYEFKKGEVKEVKKPIADLLIQFGYAEEVKKKVAK